ncbi:bifunctional diaminohydroxyphosphoribosylaminopyrimidine deaminase/5-amino-6-(5-phosphoribosylamino)uracil reductase RibD [Lentibacillus sp. N15]|uniref:bifunctional diaminohydroxyphosphoribosylaminopyrimidine deaminase/5-amino-6-(5-phosphoribosylamino)uracil reductase RibD n=1 Tax=Lentibacillus songyuanensis TaxID=3136161 RepID=UPI0031BA16E1
MNDKDYMELALKLATAVLGQTSPNPPVGAVVVKDDVIVGFGAHLKAGEAHAEVYALDMAGEKANGATIFVTLEPCSHTGKTSPCADYIIAKGIHRVVVAVADPNKKVSGRGIAKLRSAGITVEVGMLQAEAEQVNRVFFHYITTGMPYVTLKAATSLDGKTATVTGESKWITGEEARLDGHRYRHYHDAILVGVNTILADNPRLTTRIGDGGKNPIRVVLDTMLKTPLDAKVVTDKQAKTIIFTSKDVPGERLKLFQKQEQVTVIPIEHQQVHIEDVLRYLGKKRITSLLVEGGAKVNGSFLAAKKIDQFIIYMATQLIGGANTPTSFAGAGFEKLSDALSMEIKQVEMIGETIKITCVPRKDDSDVYRDC